MSLAASCRTSSSSTGRRHRRSTIRRRRSSCWPRPAIRTASTPATTLATAPYANIGEAALDNLAQIGIRAKLRPLERAAFIQGYADKKYRNIIQGGSGAFGNVATRMEAFVVKGGAYVYGSYPDIDALYPVQAVEGDHAKRAAILARMQQTGRR